MQTEPPTTGPLPGPKKAAPHAAKSERAPVSAKVGRKTKKAIASNPSTAQTAAVITNGLHTDTDRYLRALIRDFANFPKPGVLYRDITKLLATPRAFHIVLDSLAERFIGERVDAIVGIEARGFIFGGALAARLNASFVPARKPGRLPGAVDRVGYATEYSQALLEMHRDSLPESARVLVVDDVLGTGGTAEAASELVRRQGGEVIACAFALELAGLRGREKLMPTRVECVVTYD
jgi:adenine phosphoribosyltransferase